MKVISEISEQYKDLALALGFFDGVHIGHRRVITSAVDFAREKGVCSAVVTFKEHPQVLLKGVSPQYILTVEQRREKLEALGVDYCFELDFSQLSAMSAQQYLQDFLIRKFSPIFISSGFNHYFGAGKSGSPELLAKNAEIFRYKYLECQPVKIGEEIVSSSIIRKLLLNGDVKNANLMLEDTFKISGVVQKGAGLGKKIGFKTANLVYPDKLVCLPFGVFSVVVQIGSQRYRGVANFGVKPTFEDLVCSPVLEVHIIDFNDDVYGQNIVVEFVDFIRAEKKFVSIEGLISQIKSDIAFVKS